MVCARQFSMLNTVLHKMGKKSNTRATEVGFKDYLKKRLTTKSQEVKQLLKNLEQEDATLPQYQLWQNSFCGSEIFNWIYLKQEI